MLYGMLAKHFGEGEKSGTADVHKFWFYKFYIKKGIKVK